MSSHFSNSSTYMNLNEVIPFLRGCLLTHNLHFQEGGVIGLNRFLDNNHPRTRRQEMSKGDSPCHLKHFFFFFFFFLGAHLKSVEEC